MMDGYLQPGRQARPAVIVIHGGGGRSGSRVSYVGQFLELLTRSGHHWFSIDYRLEGPERLAESVDDLRAAIGFIRCHARELRVDPERIMLLGEETGATMAALAAADPANRIRAQVLIGGRYPLHPLSAGDDWKRLPATLIIHGTDDREVAPELAEESCRAIGPGCRYLPVAGASHRPENWWPSQWGYRKELAAWLDRQAGIEPGSQRPRSYRKTRLVKDIVYDAPHGLKMDAWVPNGRGPFPAVILAHGGGWEAGDKVTYLTPILRPLAEAGFAWFSIDYRLTPEVDHAKQLEDLRTAIRHVHRNARRLKIDPGRIAILGESASGQMVAQVATERMAEVAAVVSFYGVYDLLAMAGRLDPRSIPARLFGIRTLGETERQTLINYSPLHQARAGMPPLLLLCGTADGLFAQHTAMARRLGEVGAHFEAVELPGAPHGMENWEGHPEWAFYRDRLVEWLKRTLSLKDR
jgi:acetyl esterase